MRTLMMRRTLETYSTKKIPDSVIELAQKADEINPDNVKKKQIFNLAVIIGALGICVVDILAISQGFVTSDPGKKLAAFLIIGAAAVFVVGLLSQSALMASVTAYQQLKILVQESENMGVTAEEVLLIQEMGHALRTVDVVAQKKVITSLRNAEPIKNNPALAEMIDDGFRSILV